MSTQTLRCTESQPLLTHQWTIYPSESTVPPLCLAPSLLLVLETLVAMKCCHSVSLQ